MTIPIDDHGFHRGDGVFEAVKWIGKKIWLLEPHLNRLQSSCDRIGIKLPMSLSNLETKIEEMVTISQKPKGLIRIFVTRGPGSFGVSPYESIAPQVYIVTTELKEWTDERVVKGASIKQASLAPKQGIFAQVKSLNYLPNVLMKKEAIDAGFDFAIGVGTDNEILESSTENLGYLKGNELITPKFDSILKGTSLIRMTELIPKDSGITWIRKSFSFDELKQADQVFLVGTTIDVLPVTNVDGVIKPHVEKVLWLRGLLKKDQES